MDILTLAAAIAVSEKRRKKLETELKELIDQSGGTSTDISEIKKEISNLQEAEKTINEAIKTINQTLTEHGESLESLTTDLGSLTTEVTRIAQECTKNCEALGLRIDSVSGMISAKYSASSTYLAGAFCTHDDKLYHLKTDITTPEAWNPAHWEQVSVDYYLSRYEGIGSKPRFGVSGVGGSAPALTRLWDAVGKTSAPGTDTVEAKSDFDAYAPFNRRKCVGTWVAENGKAAFRVAAYHGDPDYAEDGSMGDYVAVDVTPFYYIEEGGILGVSEQQFPGWKPHPVCVDLDGNIRAHTYLPVYGLSMKDGKAVSLPGMICYGGSYKVLWDDCKTYGDGSLADYAILEPSAVDHYEWLLQTIEYATQNVQSIQYGAATMWLDDANSQVVAAPADNQVVVKSGGSNLVPHQYINFGTSIWGVTNDASVMNKVVSVQNCDETGALNSAGAYRLVTYDGTNRTVTPNTTKLASRPWPTGTCTGSVPGIGAVKGHTGSPISLTSGKYPMMYRWRENVYGNQMPTAVDLMDVRVDEGGEKYHLDWYFLPDPRKYAPATADKPDVADLEDSEKGWVKLNVQTPSSSYVNGYIKEEAADDRYPHVKVPVLTTGGSATTYTCDWAALVNSPVVRAVRRRGRLYYGTNAGPRFVEANNAPSHSDWLFGGGLFFIQ